MITKISYFIREHHVFAETGDFYILTSTEMWCLNPVNWSFCNKQKQKWLYAEELFSLSDISSSLARDERSSVYQLCQI